MCRHYKTSVYFKKNDERAHSKVLQNMTNYNKIIMPETTQILARVIKQL